MAGQDLAPTAIAIGAVVLGALYFLWSSFGSKSPPKIPKDSTPFLNKTKQKVKLIKKDELSPDTFLYRFGLSNPKEHLGLPVGKHIKVYGKTPTGKVPGQWNGKEIADAEKSGQMERKYTPTTLDFDLGHFDLVVKVYKPGNTYSPPRDRFSDGGMMSQFIDSIKLNEEIEIFGPVGHIEYTGRGQFEVSRKPLPVMKRIGMIAGGTGITPMLQIASYIVQDPGDNTKISLLFANQTEEDILLRDRLSALASAYPSKFSLHLTLDRPPTGWKGHVGFISDAMLSATMPPPAPDTVILMCGPPPMLDFACRPNLEKLGYDKASIHAF